MAKACRVRSATINDAENGYEVQHDLEPDADDAKGSGLIGYQPPKKHVFGHHEHEKMMGHVASLFPPRKTAKPPKAMDDRKPGETYADTLSRKAAEGRKKKA